MKQKLYFLVALAGALLLLASGCSPSKKLEKRERKAEKKITKIYLDHPDLVAKKTREWYPVTSTIIRDSSLYKKWLASLSEDLFFEEEAPEPEIPIELWEDSVKIRELANQNRALRSQLQKRDEKIRLLHMAIQDIPPVIQIVKEKDSADLRIAWAVVDKLRADLAVKDDKLQTKNKWLRIFGGLAAFFLLALAIIIYLLIKNKRNATDNKL